MQSRESTPTLPSPEISRGDIIKHIENNTVAVKDGRKCVDGRYGHGEDSGRLARPGGDFGYVMVLLALRKKLGLTPQQCVDAVYKAVTKDNGKFYMHTDDHEDHTHTIGCGHIAGCLEDEDIAEALACVLQKSENLQLVRLQGKHAEKAVLKILGIKKTVNSHGKDMFFIYDAERDKQFIRELVAKMNIENLTADDFQRAANQQTNATLKKLALDKPIYEINIDNKNEPIIKFAGHVTAEPLSKAA